MRARRPELFSDTAPMTVSVLDKGYLEYHLDTLTSRKQEQMFEEFARRLAEVEICPNLVPQTGPTGGGDSKTDASTYPVSPALAARCWWGSPAPPTNEKWAFAFSCKQRWKPKLIDDMGKIAALNSGFSKAFFMSNQFIRDKARASEEQALTRKHGFGVHILDRTWIVKSVIEHKREDIAIQVLGIRATEQQKPTLGPRDVSRQREFADLVAALGDPGRYRGNDYALSQAYLTAGLLARALGKLRHEVDGLFARARSLAVATGYPGLVVRAAYDHAWTSFWWFDDATALASIYGEIEAYLSDTPDPEICLLFANLWRLLVHSVQVGYLTTEESRSEERATAIRRELRRLADDRTRPNGALQAETELFLLDLHPPFSDPSRIERAFSGLKKCLRRSAGLGTYPAMEIMDSLGQAGEFLGGLPGYDSLFDEIRRLTKNRLGETAEGKVLYNRGMQLADKRRPEETLRMLGQARTRLFKKETMREALRASLACSDAYRSMHLYWAARMEALTAAHIALRTPEAADEFPTEGAIAAVRMAWLELALARVAPFLAWYNVSWCLVSRLRSIQFDPSSLEEELTDQDGVLGCLFLKLPRDDVEYIQRLEPRLDDLNLPMARYALLHALGREDMLAQEWPGQPEDRQARMREFFAQWKQQPAMEQLPGRLAGEAPRHAQYTTAIMGVRYCIDVVNEFGPIGFAENLLGIIEAALSLAKWENLAFIVDQVQIEIALSDSGTNPPPFALPPPPAAQVYKLAWGSDMLKWLAEVPQDAAVDYFKKVLLSLLLSTTIDPLADLTDELRRWDSEDTFSRALGTSPTIGALTDLVRAEQYDLRHWCKASASSPV
jgi:hypothetical protein